ncbi:hypothetical protein GE061_003423 [Apolygus lucorum]|uniref:C2H2-type domain-containing protein n=1 Tax=Apolygus lucorum TaxID=248454 RepID=A0A8S9X3W2_APOLU|nr:hypothetical protein GE061_003423 [Apolygus lucorum]
MVCQQTFDPKFEKSVECMKSDKKRPDEHEQVTKKRNKWAEDIENVDDVVEKLLGETDEIVENKVEPAASTSRSCTTDADSGVSVCDPSKAIKPGLKRFPIEPSRAKLSFTRSLLLKSTPPRVKRRISAGKKKEETDESSVDSGAQGQLSVLSASEDTSAGSACSIKSLEKQEGGKKSSAEKKKKETDRSNVDSGAKDLLSESPVSKNRGKGSVWLCKCGKNFTKKFDYLAHVKMECGKPPKFNCMTCDFKSHWGTKLEEHLEQVHHV